MTDVTLRYLLFGEDKSASKTLKNVGKDADSALDKVKKGAIGVGAALGGIGIAAVAKQSVELEGQFGQTMAMMAASIEDPEQHMKSLNDLAMDLGAATSFSANDAAGAMLELAKAGVDVTSIMGGGVQGTLSLAAAEGTNLGVAATIASNAMNTFSLKGKDMGLIADALAGGALASSASVESLGQALQQVGPGATNAGLSLQETVATLAAFDAAGIKGSDSGTSLKTMLARLVPQTDAASGAMRKLGLDFVDAKGNFVSITEVSQQLQDKLGKLSEAERTKALATIFGSDASRAATVLMKEGAAGLGEFIAATNDAGAAQDMATARMSGTKGAIERMSGSVETAQLAFGQMLAPAVTAAADAMAEDALPAVIDFMGGMQDGTGAGGAFADVMGDVWSATKSVAGVIADVVGFFVEHERSTIALTAAIAALVIVTKIHAAVLAVQAAGGLAAMIKALPIITALTRTWAAVQWLLNAALVANPIGLVIIALVALGVIFAILWAKSDKFRAVLTGAFSAVWKAAGSALGWIKANWPLILAVLTGPIGIAVLVITRNWDRIKSGAMGLVNFVRSIPGRLRALAGGFGEAGRWLIDKFLSGLSKTGGFVADFAGGVWKAVKALINGGIDRLNNALEFNISVLGKDIGVNPKDIPHLADGGIVRARPGGVLVRLGEGGRDEAVVPIGGTQHVAGRNSGGDLGEVVVVVVSESGEVIEEKLAKVKRRRGGKLTRLAFES